MTETKEKLITLLQKINGFAIRMLAILMTFVIVWGVGDVVYMLYQRLKDPPFMLLDISDILATFGALLAVLIAVEIFVNITLYLKEKEINVKFVLATALMAIARKVIIFDYKTLEPSYIYASGVVILSLGISYWLIAVKTEHGIIKFKHEEKET